MKYEKLINEQFSKIGFIPRTGQVKTINDIIYSFKDDEKKYVTLVAPTGSGKSIIGVISSMCLEIIDTELNEMHFDRIVKGEVKKTKYKTAEILSHTNILSHQYHDTFGDLYDEDDNNGFAIVKGASHYNCKALGDDANATDCIIKLNPASMTKHCLNCEYLKMKKNIKKKNNLITNYSYYFADKVFSHQLPIRLLTIFDEVQLIDSVFTSMYALKLNEEILDRMIGYLEKNKINGINFYIAKLEEYKQSIFIDYNYNEIDTIMRSNLSEIYELFGEIAEFYGDNIKDNYLVGQPSNIDTYIQIKNSSKIKKLNRIKSIFQSKFSAYEVMNAYIFNTDNYVGEYKNKEISFKPIFIRDLFKEKLTTSKYILMMSATISDVYISQTLNIPLNEMAFINAEPIFKPENKTIYMFNHASYNFQYLKNQTNLETITNLISEILDHHDDENGIIQVTSFYLLDRITWFLKKNNKQLYKKLFIHKKGEKLEHILTDFKMGNKQFLISPSLWEGIDLADDFARFNIMVKCPFYSLADSRIKMIMEQYPDIYKLMTLFRMVQGAGRAVRSENDYATTYMLDSNLNTLFNSKLNIWKNQFNVINI